MFASKRKKKGKRKTRTCHLPSRLFISQFSIKNPSVFNFCSVNLLFLFFLSSLQAWSSCSWVGMWFCMCPRDSNSYNTPNLDARTHDIFGIISFLVSRMYFSQVRSQLHNVLVDIIFTLEIKQACVQLFNFIKYKTWYNFYLKYF